MKKILVRKRVQETQKIEGTTRKLRDKKRKKKER
jgi:hypothetical protein